MALVAGQACFAALPAAAQIRPPEFLRRSAPAPDYPYESRKRSEVGDVRVRLHVDPTGTVEHIDILDGSGSPASDTAALVATANWRFRPALWDGKPVPSAVATVIRFRSRRR